MTSSSAPQAPAPELAGRIALVTGAKTGIGKETARGLAARGAHVVMACRDLARGEAARAELAATVGGAGQLSVMALDLADTSSIRAFGGQFAERFERLDILVNNAGVNPTTRQLTRDGFELTFGVNHLGTFLLTDELVELLKRSAPSRIVVVSSRLHARGKMVWDDLMFERRSYGSLAAYNQSKLANVLFANALGERLAGTGVTVNSLHPGVVRTELMRSQPDWLRRVFHGVFRAVTPAEGAACSLHVATAPELAEVTGRYFDDRKAVAPSKAALDRRAQQRLWDESERLLGIVS